MAETGVDNIDEIFKRYEGMKRERGVWESHWEEISERCLPRSSLFVGHRTGGDKRTEKLYDATAALALERFASAVESLLTPRGARWHTLRATDKTLDADYDVRLWFDTVEDMLFQQRYSPKANFASQMHEGYISLGAFGTGTLFVGEDKIAGMHYRAVHLGDIFIAEDEHGKIDTVFREFNVAARQVMRMFPDANLSADLKKIVEDKPDTRVDILHVVMPRSDRDPTSRRTDQRPWLSNYYEVKEKHLLEEGGEEELPYIMSRYVTGPREVYGRSPAMLVLPEIKMINEMSKTVIKAGQKVVDPPLIIADDGVILPVDLTPGGATFARLDGRGQAPIQPLLTGGRVDIGLEMMDQRRRVINDAFLVTLFQILVETPQMTATEVLQRAQEKGALLAPTVGRQQSETLGPLVEREIAILARQGILPPPPPLLEEAEGEFEIEYVSPLSRALKAEEGVGILRTLEMVQPIAAVDPGVMDNFDTDEITRILSDTNGAPKRILRRIEEVQQMREARQQMNSAQQMIGAAEPASKAALNVAKINELIATPGEG
jgi:hypothetical protein